MTQPVSRLCAWCGEHQDGPEPSKKTVKVYTLCATCEQQDSSVLRKAAPIQLWHATYRPLEWAVQERETVSQIILRSEATGLIRLNKKRAWVPEMRLLELGVRISWERVSHYELHGLLTKARREEAAARKKREEEYAREVAQRRLRYSNALQLSPQIIDEVPLDEWFSMWLLHPELGRGIAVVIVKQDQDIPYRSLRWNITGAFYYYERHFALERFVARVRNIRGKLYEEDCRFALAQAICGLHE